ncbi:hypothetical protein SLE2022_337500 [Rubroshorea leprosula]
MEHNKKKLIILLSIASVAALSIIFRRRRQKKNRHAARCYLHTDPKPQYTFKHVLADNSYSPFNHLNLDGLEEKSHPYEADITAFIDNPPVEFKFLEGVDVDLEMNDSYVWVDTESQLTQLADALSKEKVFAVDTEQHSLRSFLGFTALIQISTKKDDYLVDTIALHDSMSILGPVFADPNICKVFHGADGDVVWLQRDFHLYVVNLFDTAKACEVLSKPQKSLAYLLETYCSVEKNKSLQREDWRHRPLPVDMVQYAQADAHYLLYIANCLIAEMKELDIEYSSSHDDKFHFVLEASRRSNMICLQLYTKDIEDSPGESAASSILSRQLNSQGGGLISNETKFQDIVRQLCAWRDLMARIHDESTRYVLSDQAIVAIADKAPTTQEEICSIVTQADMNVDASFFPSPSPILCSHWGDVCQIMLDKLGSLDNFFPSTLQECLGPHGSCPLSIFNYALLVNSHLKLTTRFVSKQNEVKNLKQVAKKNSRELFIKKFSCKSPVYHNCRIYANDGRLLCYCDRRKLEWYLRRDLAQLVEEDPPAIMLLFEPKGRPEDEDNDFYIQSKKNICVGCGVGNHYLRYRVIPSCYRVHFPEHLKSHRSHDIVLLCVDCHEIAHAAAEKHKRKISAEFGIPLYVQKVVDSNQTLVISGLSDPAVNFEESGVSPLQLRAAAKALLRHGPEMPPSRCEELTQIVMKYYGGREISKEDLERALVVGMTPHEIRRLEKKRGLSLKHSTGTVLPDKKQQEIRAGSRTLVTIKGRVTSYSLDSLDAAEDVSYATIDGTLKEETLSKSQDRELCMITDSDTSNPLPCNDVNLYTSEVSDTEGVFASNTNNSFQHSVQEAVNSTYPRNDGSFQSKHNSKLSLLGHGPHGKQVVDHLLKEYGGEGIRQFCQRWRQVFVDSVHPRFLPTGWDVMHSGRREFGEFSVYNPAKKVAGDGDAND